MSDSEWLPTLSRIRSYRCSLVVSLFVRKQGRPFVSLPNNEGLADLKEFTEAGKVAPVIDRTYSLAETAEAIAHVGEGHAQGKTVITV